jgi:hypothetical protein
MTVYLENSLPKLPYMHRINVVVGHLTSANIYSHTYVMHTALADTYGM